MKLFCKPIILFIVLHSALNVHAQYTINGTTNIPNGITIYLQREFPSDTVEIDSCVVNNGKFYFKKQNFNTYDYVMTNQKYIGNNLRFIWDGKISIFLDSALTDSKVENSPLTAAYNYYDSAYFSKSRNKIIAISKQMNQLDPQKDTADYARLRKEQNEVVKYNIETCTKYVDRHPDTYLSLGFLDWLWSQISDGEKIRLYKKVMAANSINHPYKQILEQKYDALAKDE